MTNHHIRTTCRLCGSTRLETLLELPATPLANEYPMLFEGELLGLTKLTVEEPNPPPARFHQDRFPLYLVGCESCGHVQLPVVVDPKRLFPPDYPYQSGTSAVFRAHLAELAGVIGRLKSVSTPMLALDIACNDGELVRAMQREGIEGVRGIDPCAPEGPEFKREFFTAEWAAGLARDGGRFDVVTALNVCAHVDNLDDFARGVKVLLEPGGLFVVEVGYVVDVCRRGLFPTIYHEHLSYHSLAPLVPFFERHGMTLVDAHRIDSQGGSVRIFVRNGTGHEQSDRLRELLAEEQAENIWDGVRRLEDKMAETRETLLRELSGVRGKVIGYGAPAKLTTTLHGCAIPPELFAYVVDDNPKKIGRYVPGTAIPIVPTSRIYEDNPEVIVLFSANFADDIKARHAEYKGRWLCI